MLYNRTLKEVPMELIIRGARLRAQEALVDLGISTGRIAQIVPAICNAIYDAVGVRLYDLPALPDRVRRRPG